MSEYDIDMIADALSKNNNQDVVVQKTPGMDHWYTLHNTALDSYQGKPGRWEAHISEQLIEWAKSLNNP